MVIYEVNIRIQKEIRQDFLPWLESHIQEMLTLPGFISANCFQIEEDPLQFCVHYFLKDLTALKHYLKHEAPRMRGDGLKTFTDKMNIHRRTLLNQKSF